MKKRSLLFALIIFSGLLFSCNGGGSPSPSGGSAINYFSVPNWANDTLIGRSQFNPTMRDTMFSFTSAGKSYIKYRGVQYEIKAFMLFNQPINPAAQTYFINVYSMGGVLINDSSKRDAAAYPYQWYDSTTSSWETEYQSVMINHPPFSDSVTGSLWSTVYK